ncbi:hypothetical protein L873DRAFT_1759419 [Choiromyces venosus 120613-1]|uniref:Uncharacterized protein n=1 Tax=Choiromyces venosus 120613-1 TaxID=1336337 RepID=A0A3N4K4B7_9PEZI|nr:hypothetical protein L873DRAFT_1759419 [Choiromyces venosus 120613-1]
MGQIVVGFPIQPEYKSGLPTSINSVNPAWRQNGLHIITCYVAPSNYTPAQADELSDTWVTVRLEEIRQITPRSWSLPVRSGGE